MTDDWIARSDLRGARTLARTELRTYLRNLMGDTRQVLGVAFLGLLFGVLFPLLLVADAIAFGERLATGVVPLGAGGRILSAVVLVAGYVGGAGGFNQPRVGQVGPLIRTSIPPAAVSLGRFANRTAQILGLLFPASLVLLVGVAAGSGGVIVPSVVALAAIPLFAAALIVGRIVGDLARYANERFQVSLWLKAIVTVVLMAAIFLGTQLLLGTQFEDGGEFGTRFGGALLPGEPIQAYASVAFAPLGSTPEALGFVVAALTVAAIPLGLAVAIALETRMLVSDPGSDAAETTVASSRGVPSVFGRWPATRVAWRYLLRTRRDPRTLAHLTPLLFGLFPMALSTAQDPGSLLVLGPGLVVFGTVLAGAAYCLNPLGDERDQLTLLLTSMPSIGVVLRGRIVAGSVLGLFVGVGIGAPVSLLAHSPAFVFGQSLLAVFLAAVSGAVAVGIGAVAPQFERREYMSVERAHPSTTALMGFFFGAMAVGGVGLVLLWRTLVGERPVAVGLGWLVYLTALSLAGWGAYRYAVARFDAFTLDDI